MRLKPIVDMAQHSVKSSSSSYELHSLLKVDSRNTTFGNDCTILVKDFLIVEIAMTTL